MGINNRDKVKQKFLSGLIVFFTLTGISFAVDSPHSSADNVDCNKCHTLHKAPGSSLTSEASNENLCLSCHKPTGLASAKSFTVTENSSVFPGISGRQHRWDGVMPASSSPSNTYGLRAGSDLGNTDLKVRLTVFNNVVVCSVCHNQHSQDAAPWDPASSPAYTAGVTTNRHFMRTQNDLNQLCEDCHYYRTPGSVPAGGNSQTNVREWDGNIKSHPLVKNISTDVINTTQFVGTPLDANYSAQTTSPRYHVDSDGNPTNNIVFDKNGKIRCLSCHGIHYTDSDAGTYDSP